MFGRTNWKQEIKDKEQELATCKASLKQAEQILGKLSLMWIDAEQRMSEMERGQREMERQMKQVDSAVNNVSRESERHLEKGQKLLQQMEGIAGKQKELRTQQKQIQKESSSAELEKPISLAKIIAPVTAELSQGMEEMRNMLEDVVELGKQMEVLSLNAAVEAGRMGESGRKFVEAAEEVRGLSDKYQQTTSTLAQHLQLVGMKWQKSRGEIEETEGQLKQQYARLESARNACTIVGEEILNLPITELHDEMEKSFADDAMEDRCQEISKEMDKVRKDFGQQQETWSGIRQTAAQAKALVKDLNDMS